MSDDPGGGREPGPNPRVGLESAPFPAIVAAARDLCEQHARPLWRVSLGCYLPLAAICALALAVLRDDLERTVGVLAYLLLARGDFLAQVQLARYVAKDWLGQPLSGDCGAWWRRHLPGVVQSAGATFVALCGVYGAIYFVYLVVALVIGSDNEPAQAVLAMLVGYAVWFADLAYRAMAVFVPAVTGIGQAAGWDALSRSFRLVRLALARKSELVPLSLGVDLVLLRIAFLLAGVFEGREPLAFVLVHAGLATAVRPVLSVVQGLFLIDALGREHNHDEAALTAILGGAVGSR